MWHGFGALSVICGLPMVVPIGGYPYDGFGLDRAERIVHVVHRQREILAEVAPGGQQRHNRRVDPREALLVRDALMRRTS